jgi:general secretion pathway protein M
VKAWWQNRDHREQLVLKTAAVVISLMLVWALVLQPLSARQSALQARIAAQQATLGQLAEAQILLSAQSSTGAGKQDFGDRSMASMVEQGLRMAGLAAAIRRIEPVGDGSISLVLEQAAFDPLVRWLQEASLESGITVRELSMDAAASSGKVNARVLLAADS